MTMKRKSVDEHAVSSRPVKRQRQGTKIHLFDLSDELLLRTLSYLFVGDLNRCERVCHKLQGLAVDNELWREKYYNQFVRHRARRLPGLRPMTTEEQEGGALLYSSREARWLEHSHLVKAGCITNWKRSFKVKHNWTKGRARASEVQVDARAVPAVLAKVHRGHLYTADSEHGLRIWQGGAVKHMHPLNQKSCPSALDVQHDGGISRVALGYEDGSVSSFVFTDRTLSCIASAQPSKSALRSISMAWPYVMTMSTSNSIHLLQASSRDSEPALKEMASLYCESELSPASLSLRKTKTALVAGIAYAFNRFNTGWCLGVQEVRMDLEGIVIENRTTSSVTTSQEAFITKSPHFTSRSASTSPFGLHPQFMRAPNSLSYCGCYILAGLPDNTLMVYTVSSTDDKLEINVGRRLWGHTSAVSAAEVTSTGKAVSISANSDEMRYWELEEVLSSYSPKKTSTAIHPLNMLNEAIARRGDGIGLSLKEVKLETDLIRRCVSFDDEQAIVVGERDQRQVISCFDFA